MATEKSPDAKGSRTDQPQPQGVRLQKFLAEEGFGSRREIERQIEARKVKVNGKIAALGVRVLPGDKIQCSGKTVTVGRAKEAEVRVVIYNKPEGEICSNRDPEGRKTVFEKLPPLPQGRWISVGRLDFNSSGLLLFTNNGELANRLMHPSSGIDREYLVRVQGRADANNFQAMLDGVMLEDGVARFTDIVEGDQSGSNNWYYCALMEGRKREVRRLWESQGLRVNRLKRVRFGPLFLPSFLRAGQWLELEYKEVKQVCALVELDCAVYKPKTRRVQQQRERQIKRLRSAPQKRKQKRHKTRPR